MRHLNFILCVLGLGASRTLYAQTADDPNLGAALVFDPTTEPATLNFSWWGKYGYHYLIETSKDLLSPWTVQEGSATIGEDAPISIGVAPILSRYFLRAVQFDPNDVSELTDSDTDGLPDKWELYHFKNLEQDGFGDWNNDGLLDRDCFRFGLNPKNPDPTQEPRLDNFGYDEASWLTDVSLGGGAPRTHSLDDEGNLVVVSP